MIDQEALERVFREEAEELLREMERCALDLDLRLDPSLVQEMFRCAHTLKGSASCVGHERLIALAHEVEALFEAVTTRKRTLGRDLAPLALLAVDALGRCARMPNFDDPAPSAEERAFVARITAWLASAEAVGVDPVAAEAPEAAASK